MDRLAHGDNIFAPKKDNSVLLVEAPMERKFSIARIWKVHRSTIILFILIAEIVASPAADYHPWVGGLLAVSIWAILVLAAGKLANQPLFHHVILPIAILWLVARILTAVGDHRHFYARAAPVVGLLMSCVILWAILDRARTVPRSAAAAIAEALMGYLLIAIAFAEVFWILGQLLDRPFNQTIPSYQVSTFLYFSLITMSSVGYGGIAPVNPYVRMIAAFEGVTGIFYIAVVVARLVSSYQSSEIFQEYESLAQAEAKGQAQSRQHTR